jgi:hypothetical protein
MRSIVVLFAAAALLIAQAPAPKDTPAPHVRRVIDVKHLTGDRAERAVRLVNQFMHPAGTMNFDPILRTAVIVGPEDVVKGAEALLSKLDSPNAVKPDRQVQFRFYLVEASPDPAFGDAVPAEIAPAVEQMKKSFVYKGYRLLDTILLQARGSGEAGTSGVLPTQQPGIRSTYNLSYKAADILEDGKTVIVRGFRFHLRLPVGTPGQVQFADSSISTDLTIQEGQKLVVGKLSSEQAKNATFLIITVDVQ